MPKIDETRKLKTLSRVARKFAAKKFLHITSLHLFLSFQVAKIKRFLVTKSQTVIVKSNSTEVVLLCWIAFYVLSKIKPSKKVKTGSSHLKTP